MTAFLPKKLSNVESLGAILREARLAKGWDLSAIAKKINVRADYLSALEEDRWQTLPAGLYGKSYLKEYAALLGLKIRPEALSYHLSQSATPINPFSKKIVKKNKFLIFPRVVRNILISLALLICFLYLIFYVKKIVWAPSLDITNPATNIPWSSDTITITGRTEKEAEVKINGETVLNTSNGYFSQEVSLKKGLNDIIITAQKKYSRERTVTRQILAQ